MSVFGPVPEYRRKPARVRGVIVLCAAVTFALVAAFVGISAQYAKAQSLMLGSQQVMPGVDASVAEKQESVPDQQVFAPDLVSLLDKKAELAMEELGHGASIVAQTDSFDGAGKPMSTYEIALTAEPSDALAGPPTVFLAVDDTGTVTEAGFQAGMHYLGYGSLSMVDAVENVHVIEKLLGEAGLAVAVGTLTLPEDSSEYTFFGSDGVTIESQVCTFAGTGELSGMQYPWRGIVSYDYADANAKSNMAYTLRMISVFVSVP